MPFSVSIISAICSHLSTGGLFAVWRLNSYSRDLRSRFHLNSYFLSSLCSVFFPLFLFRVNTLRGTVHWSASQLNTEGFLRDQLLVFQSCFHLKIAAFSKSRCKLAEETKKKQSIPEFLSLHNLIWQLCYSTTLGATSQSHSQLPAPRPEFPLATHVFVSFFPFFSGIFLCSLAATVAGNSATIR